ncbi:xyloglucan endotransglucosylase/hydrolase protein 2-like isoform X2 [Macadamia integrifolia]|uniref:xyloglucan endotransglucosylase/hydrolase protein 2-like isoform X1 n=1 Tax=Macadamia integrifolia TaxID=60698 RepID=UPI001C4FB9C5|nr:xyloglucan endotransglucosylase/hydrolase protein 2-like isoform X1 [Macadamia integrifolia]XP_042490364.1 xyloglucan endotransglucosylase/hydrolase protein 2-like isoform X2 [Macadamia integrifolia]
MSPSLLCFLAFCLVGEAVAAGTTDPSFDTNYEITWGNDHVQSINQGREIQLSMDKSSGSGFQSKLSYGSGFFSLSIKLPGKDSAGVVTAFYLNSHTNNHDELDFEFLGNKQGKPYTLQTNVFANGVGDREQRIRLWFDPTADFHNYKILWNQHQIVFFVDTVPIRVYKNKTNIGVNYPTHAMQIEATLWDGSNWATDGGQTKADWSQAPFKANFQGFNINGCPSSQNSNTQPCYSSRYWWNSDKYWQLNSNQERAYEGVKRKYMTYDYCSDRSRYPSRPQECPQ